MKLLENGPHGFLSLYSKFEWLERPKGLGLVRLDKLRRYTAERRSVVDGLQM